MTRAWFPLLGAFAMIAISFVVALATGQLAGWILGVVAFGLAVLWVVDAMRGEK